MTSKVTEAFDAIESTDRNEKDISLFTSNGVRLKVRKIEYPSGNEEYYFGFDNNLAKVTEEDLQQLHHNIFTILTTPKKTQ